MWIKDSLTHWRTAFGFKELLEESSVHRALHLLIHVNQFDDHMFWAACLLVYFGFLRSAEFTVPSLSAFDPNRHLSVRDIAVDVPLNPSCLQICIKASKTDPFRKRCIILIGPGSPLCAVQAIVSFLKRRGNRHDPLFLFENSLPLSCSLLRDRLRAILLSAALLAILQVTVAKLGQPLLLQGLVFWITSFKFWAIGKVMLTIKIFELLLTS